MWPRALGHGLLSYTVVADVTVTELPGVVLGLQGWGGTGLRPLALPLYQVVRAGLLCS